MGLGKKDCCFSCKSLSLGSSRSGKENNGSVNSSELINKSQKGSPANSSDGVWIGFVGTIAAVVAVMVVFVVVWAVDLQPLTTA